MCITEIETDWDAEMEKDRVEEGEECHQKGY